MDTKKQLSKLLSKPMSRKEFLAHLGAGLLAVIGVSGFLKALTASSTNYDKKTGKSYGSSSYGGKN